MNTVIVSKPFNEGISRQNSTSEAQCLIDGIFKGEKHRTGTTIEFSNYDCLSSSINHIDLDNPDALVEGSDIQIARIFPLQEKNHAYEAVRTVIRDNVIPALRKLARSTKVYGGIGVKYSFSTC
jgi:hypothetical protein